MDLRRPRWGRRWWAVAGALGVLVAGGTVAATAEAGAGPAVHRHDAVIAGAGGVRLDTSYFTAGGPGRRPAVLLAHGFGGSKDDVRAQAEGLARHGYAVLTWSARGFGRSGGTIGLNAADGEVADVSKLVDWLAARPEVRLDAPGDPRVGVTGVSYGGALSLLAAAHDPRIDAIAPRETYWNLADALFPGGVYKKLWAGIFFSEGAAPHFAGGPAADGTGPAPTHAPSGSVPGTGTGAAPGTTAGQAPAPGTAAGSAAPGAVSDPACGRFAPAICAMYERVAQAGRPDAAARAQLTALSPVVVATRIKVPALIVQGQTDSLFTLGQSDAMAAALKADGDPVAVDWIAGGHDGGDTEDARIDRRVTAWFDHYLKGRTGTGTGPAFRVSRTGGLNSTDGSVVLRGADAPSYPGLAGTRTRRMRLTGGPQPVANPAGGSPPAISAVPGTGALSALSSLGAGLSLDFPGQSARFDSAALPAAITLTGAPEVTVQVTGKAPDAVLFAKLYDVAPDGKQTLPASLATPVRVALAGPRTPPAPAPGAALGRTGSEPSAPGAAGSGPGAPGATGSGSSGPGSTTTATVRLRLPAVDHRFAAGHRLRLVLSSTDLGYASPPAPALYTVALAGSGVLSVPTDPALASQPAPLPWWTWALPPAALVAAGALLLTGRRRTRPGPADPALSGVPLRISGLSKRYARSADRYAVRDLSFQVERGQVLGLLGPNGAGKTTTLRMLMGLIRPDEGEIRVFGEAVRAGAPVLSRVGAFVEGAGFLPHLSGRANLDLYWQATGRPPRDAHLEEALEIAGLGDALERAVRTYSQGMRQRLALAQAMLGLPDLLILDEPTNGLDPPQIREMRQVMIAYAAAGRTVIVSSHLLSEVEQTCTHLVVMDRGRLVTTGAVAEIVGSADTVLVAVAGELPQSVVDAVAALPGVATAVRQEDGLLAVLEGTTAARFVAELVRLGVAVERVGPHRRLEDAFLTLIGDPA